MIQNRQQKTSIENKKVANKFNKNKQLSNNTFDIPFLLHHIW